MSPETLRAVAEFVGRVGFPIAVATYLLVRMEAALAANTAAITALRLTLARALQVE